eukprot:762772-Hanusia_phi.AAC.1
MISPQIAEVFPRKRKGEIEKFKMPITLDMAKISNLFHLRQTEAAQQLGISLTALKNACRRVGLAKWPYSRKRPSNSPVQAKKSETKARNPFVQDLFVKHDCYENSHFDIFSSVAANVPEQSSFSELACRSFSWNDDDLFNEVIEHVQRGSKSQESDHVTCHFHFVRKECVSRIVGNSIYRRLLLTSEAGKFVVKPSASQRAAIFCWILACLYHYSAANLQ